MARKHQWTAIVMLLGLLLIGVGGGVWWLTERETDEVRPVATRGEPDAGAEADDPPRTRPAKITFEQWLIRHFGHADLDPEADLHGDGMTLREKYELSPAIDPTAPTKIDTENELGLQVYK